MSEEFFHQAYSNLSPDELRVAGIVEESIVDGPGLRMTVFVQGCHHHCKGCHNPQTHDFNGGQLTTVDEIFLKYAQNPLLAGMTFSGGEPFLQAHPLALLAEKVHGAGGNIVTYTGFTCEALFQHGQKEKNTDIEKLLEETDMLIDGPYIEEKRNLELLFRGSSNQRILDRQQRKKIFAQLFAKS